MVERTHFGELASPMPNPVIEFSVSLTYYLLPPPSRLRLQPNAHYSLINHLLLPNNTLFIVNL